MKNLFKNNVLFVFLLTVLLSGCAFKYRPIEPPLKEPRLTGDTFHAVDGKDLALDIYVPENDPWAILVTLHGFNDYRKAFEDSAAYFAGEGVAVYAYDQRGFGEDPEAGLWPTGDSLKKDLETLLSLLRKRHPEKPLFVLGESMGGAVALYAFGAGNAEADGLILVAPAVWGWSTMNIFYQAGLWMSARLMPWKKFSGRNLDVTPSDNREMLVELSRDPLVIKKTRVDAIYGLVHLMDAGLKAAPEIGRPTLMLYGERDDIIPEKPVGRLGEALPDHLSRVKTYPSGYHMLLRDCNGPRVWRDILVFMSEVSGKRPALKPMDQENLCQSPSSRE